MFYHACPLEPPNLSYRNWVFKFECQGLIEVNFVAFAHVIFENAGNKPLLKMNFTY